MPRRFAVLILTLTACAALAARAAEQQRKYPDSGGRAVWDRVRFKPAPGFERDMIGGKFSGSNVSATAGYEVLAEIKTAPKAGEWTEMSFDGKRPHRWLRYEAPPGSYGHIGKLEFYAGKRRLGGPGFGTIGRRTNGHDWPRVFDPRPNAWFDSDQPDGQYVGIDTWDAATAVRPVFDPPPADEARPAATTGNQELRSLTLPARQGVPPLAVTLKTSTSGATIRYTLDGTTPGPDDGMLYEKPIEVQGTTTITAVSLKPGFAPSSPTVGTYLALPPKKPELTTFHIGNSITQTTAHFATYARTAGYRHDYQKFVRPGIQISALWEKHVATNDPDWHQTFDPLKRIDHFTLQPRQMDVAMDAKYSLLFLDLIRKKSPDVQPWLYSEWTTIYRTHPTDKGTVPSPCSQMRQLVEPLTWEESAGAWLLYVEELQRAILEKKQPGKPVRIIPSTLAAGWIKNLLDHGRIPGLGPQDFNKIMFFDCVHPGHDGAYLIDLTWFSAFYGQSPEGKFLPINTSFTNEQAAAIERLAWDVVRNYPDCGLYEEGSVPSGAAQFSPAAQKISAVTPVTLSSSTPGAWFRYTLDGTTPTRTRGYVYCGVISVRPGMTLKAVAYKTGMADSPVATAEYQ
jgi:hypothetical protein